MREEIKKVEEEILKRTEELSNVSKSMALRKLQGHLGEGVDYIG